ncbi:MAG: tetratricopeptide repeat protein [Deltaproteobacteria bacterium]|nr:tetratricopeptide repeat protein [Deltaproteobacteria bacterium]
MRHVLRLCLVAWILIASTASADERADLVAETRSDLAEANAEIARLEKALRGARGREKAELGWKTARALRARARLHYVLAAEGADGDPAGALASPAVKADLDRSIELLTGLAAEHPKWDKAPEALLTAGLVMREAGRYDEMLSTFSTLKRRYPRSDSVDRALLVCGDYYFDRSELERAGRFYREVVDRPGEAFDAPARYKLAWIAVNRRDFEKALSLFEKVALQRTPTPPVDTFMGVGPRVDLRQEAINDLTYCYTEVRKPEDAFAFFDRFALEPAEAARVYTRLANRYFILDRPQAALPIYRRLLELPGDAEQKREWQERIRELETRIRDGSAP